jgi:ABC-type cobalamin/Fe3+-siderophores transport system ATPase subunit
LTPAFELRDVGMTYGGPFALRGVTLSLNTPGLTAIIGPNGAGKSTLLGIMAGLRGQSSGHCLYSGREVRAWPRKAYAREVSFVPQSLRLEFPFTAGEVAMMGRTPHCGGLFESPADAAAVESAMEATDTLPFRARDFRSLSGGERQRVVLAAALAQQPRALLLDEPATFLDLKHQLAIYRLLARLCREGLLAIVVTHEIQMAASYADRVILLSAGEVAADGGPEQVLVPEKIRAVFDVEAEVRPGAGGKPWILYG